jgi:hypothetical protein
MRLSCKAYVNHFGFKVGVKYLTIFNVNTLYKERHLLTPQLKNKLQEIVNSDLNDAQVTYAVLKNIEERGF